MSVDRNRTTVRRALRAGGVAALLAAVTTAILAVTSGLPGGAVIASTITAFAVVAASWLLLAALLDVLAGEPPDLRRTLWTAGITLLAMLGPFLVISAIFQPVAAGAAS